VVEIYTRTKLKTKFGLLTNTAICDSIDNKIATLYGLMPAMIFEDYEQKLHIDICFSFILNKDCIFHFLSHEKFYDLLCVAQAFLKL